MNSPTANHNVIPEDLSNYKVVRRGNLVINKMKAWQGSLGVAKQDGIVSPAYFVFDLAHLSVPYAHVLLRSKTYVSYFGRVSDGVRIAQWDLSIDGMKRIPVLVPPLDEQAAIVRFLDDADRKINRYIRAKKRLIALLSEQKQSIVHRAVTRGLDSNVKLKPSGLDWMEALPVHWSSLVVKRWARQGYKTFTDGDWIEAPYITDSGIRLIQTGNVGKGEYREKGFRFVSKETFRALRCTEVETGDVLVCRLDGPVGRACLAPGLPDRMITSVDNVIIKTRADVDARFIVYVMSSPCWLEWIQTICRAGGGFRYRISRSTLGAIGLPIAPEDNPLAGLTVHDYENLCATTDAHAEGGKRLVPKGDTFLGGLQCTNGDISEAHNWHSGLFLGSPEGWIGAVRQGWSVASKAPES